MSELLGFIVLAGPLIPILIWLVVCILLVIFLIKSAGSGIHRASIKSLVFLMIFLLPFSDEIVGQVYFNSLCKADAGYKVHQTVVLPEEYWGADGAPTFIEHNGNYHMADMYPIKYRTGTYSSVFNIDDSGYSIVNLETGEELGIAKEYMYWGGWLKRNFSPHNTAKSCKGVKERFITLMQNVFIKEDD
jgi:hypothetical protein